jgi:hypothetical protein
MTAAELIKQLQTLPPETKIVVRGYEDGYNDILKLTKIKVRRNEQAPWYLGEYQDSEDGALTAVNLYGENKNPKDDTK